MLNLNNNAAHVKRTIMAEIVKLQLSGTLPSDLHRIIWKLVPKDGSSLGCCIYHDREILRLRMIAQLGCSVEDYDEEKRLSDYVTDALQRSEPSWPMLTVLDLACNACVKTHFMITNACQACFARPCMINCGKKAISIKNGRAQIDEEKCVNCGLCLQNCPYHAIIKIPVPCEEACPVGAISKDAGGKEQIDYHKCIYCGNCMRECPFGAMMDKSQLVDVVRRIMAGEKVVALYAPAAAAQFRAAPGQLEAALRAAGFSRVWEVAIGADITADREAKEFRERMERGDAMMTTSCCPAYVRAVRLHAPALAPCISETGTPMHYTAEIAKKADSDCLTVFIGPCLAKRREGRDDPFVDYVLSIEEVGALFMAKNIDVGAVTASALSIIPTNSGRNFARSGGVAEAVQVRLGPEIAVRPAIIDGLDKGGIQKLRQLGTARSDAVPPLAPSPNLIEVMSCPGGCIAGPSVVTNPKVALMQLTKYVDNGAKDAVAVKNQ